MSSLMSVVGEFLKPVRTKDRVVQGIWLLSVVAGIVVFYIQRQGMTELEEVRELLLRVIAVPLLMPVIKTFMMVPTVDRESLKREAQYYPHIGFLAIFKLIAIVFSFAVVMDIPLEEANSVMPEVFLALALLLYLWLSAELFWLSAVLSTGVVGNRNKEQSE